MDKQKFIDLVSEWIGKMYRAEMSEYTPDKYKARLDFIKAVRDSDASVDMKQDIKEVIDSTLLRENMDAIEKQISAVMVRHGMELPKVVEPAHMQAAEIISDIVESKKKMFFDAPQKKHVEPNVEKPVMEPVVAQVHKYSDDALIAVKDAIFSLEMLVSSDPDSEYRFVDAVKHFHSVISNSKKIPSDLAKQFTTLEYQPFSGQHNYINTLNREYEWCKKCMVTQEVKEVKDEKEKPFIINEDGEIVFNPKFRPQNTVKKTTNNPDAVTIRNILSGRKM
ncbi:MAG: hypothetical protein IKZ64_03095 [Alphaproteobacteria bacterium]|nr:hypothetical protein [Alphaproteobacteria bacterium]